MPIFLMVAPNSLAVRKSYGRSSANEVAWRMTNNIHNKLQQSVNLRHNNWYVIYEL